VIVAVRQAAAKQFLALCLSDFPSFQRPGNPKIPRREAMKDQETDD
jgi:hypothetical protein